MEKRLTKAEKKDLRNRKLCLLAKANDLEAQTRLLCENEGLIVQLAKRLEIAHELDIHHYGGIELDDILQEGRFAMLEAAKLYDTSSTTKFTSFAYTIMKNAMSDLCRKADSSFERNLAKKGIVQVFLNDTVKDSDGVLVCETIPDSRQSDPVGNLAVLHVMLEKMYNRLELLPARQRRIISYHYGLYTLEFETIERTAAYFHLTENLILAIEKQALDTLRVGMNDGKII